MQPPRAPDGGKERLAVLRDLRPRQAGIDRPLVLVLSRDPSSVHAGWRKQTLHQALHQALALGLLATLAWGGLLQQRRRAGQEERDERAECQRQLQAEWLELTLAGAKLALWDSDLVKGSTVVNARWFQKLGHADGAFDPATGRAPRVRLEDLDAVRQAEGIHGRGETPGFENTYRLRHALGHWVLARGRVVERGPEGQPLRVVGTHMDVTGRMQAQEAPRRSEHSLAITLASIGDAVIATDTAGCVTRMNPAAERLTAGEGAADVLGVVLVFSDVTGQYRMLQALRDRERQFSAVAEALPGPGAREAGS